MIATFIVSSSSSFSSSSGKLSYTASSISPIPIALVAESGCGSPNPKL